VTRPVPLFRIHDSTPIFARRPDSGSWNAWAKLSARASGITSGAPHPSTSRKGLHRENATYAICGSAMILTAALTRAFTDAGPELLGLVVIGILLLIGSADLPANTKGRTR